MYNFVRDSDDPAMKNQMAAFKSVLGNATQPFDGTIIRIPLRTREQASKSEIVRREATVLELREVLEKFARDFGKGGLLFLRNIEKISIDSTTGMSISIEIADREDLRRWVIPFYLLAHAKMSLRHKSKVNQAVKLALEEQNYTFDHAFDVNIHLRLGENSSKTCFVVHHIIRGDFLDKSMKKWMREQKLVPWVAIAAEIPVCALMTYTDL